MDEYEELRTNTSSLGKVILEINQMCKKPTIDADLSQAIDIFTKNVNESNKYLENGIFTVNFTEAALFLQSATDFWSKKVDLLWDNILDYQKRIILYDKKENDSEVDKLEERINRYKRKKTKIIINPELVTAENLLFDMHEFDQEEEYVTNGDLEERWRQRYPDSKLKITGESDKIMLKRDRIHVIENFPIYDLDDDPEVDDPVLYYKQWHELDMVKFLFRMYDEGFLEDELEAITQLRIDIDLVYQYRLEHNIHPSVPRQSFEEDLQKYAKMFMKAQRTRLSPELEKARKAFCPADTVINLQRLPMPLVNEKLRRMTVDSKSMPDLAKSSAQEKEHFEHSIVRDPCDAMEKDTAKVNKTGNSDKNLYKSQDSGISEEMDDSVVEIIQTPPPMVIIDPLPEMSDIPLPDDQVQSTNQTEPELVHKPEQKTVIAEKIVKTKNAETAEQTRKRKQLIEESECPAKRRKLTKKQIRALSKPIVEVNMSQFEKFYFFNYKSGENEGEILSMHFDDESDEEGEFLGFSRSDCAPSRTDDDDDNDDNGSQEDSGYCSLIEASCEEPTTNQSSQNEPAISTEKTTENSITTQIEESSTSTVQETSTLENTEEPSSSTQSTKRSHMWGPTEEDFENIRKNVRDWKRRIEPKLKTLSGTELDIHAYGSEIMDSMELNEVKKFKTITHGKSSSEVVRLFISTLQLANTSNIEIGGVLKGQLSNDTLSVKLLKRDRYHEHLIDFEAPSEEHFRTSIKRMREKNPHITSTPSTSHKRSKHY